jgi:hypothetical protein
MRATKPSAPADAKASAYAPDAPAQEPPKPAGRRPRLKDRKRQVTFWLPHELAAELRDYCAETYAGPSDVAIEALTAYLAKQKKAQARSRG